MMQTNNTIDVGYQEVLYCWGIRCKGRCLYFLDGELRFKSLTLPQSRPGHKSDTEYLFQIKIFFDGTVVCFLVRHVTMRYRVLCNVVMC